MNLRNILSLVTLCCTALLFSCTSGEVTIGVIIPQEGTDLADYGYQITSGIQMAHESLNNSKLKRKYKLVIKNETNDLEKVKAHFTELKEMGAKAVIGAASSASTLALAEMANEQKIVLLSPASSSPDINKENTDFVFRNYPSDTLEAQALSNTIFQKCRLQKVLMVRARDAYSEGITYALLRFARQNSKDIPNEVVKFDSDVTKVDYDAVVNRIVEINPRALFIGAYLKSMIPLLQEIRTRPELDELYVFTSSSFVWETAIKEADKSLFDGLIFTAYEWEPYVGDPEMQEFAKTFEAKFGAPPTIYAATGYDAMNILVEALEKAEHLLPEEVRSNMNNLEFAGILGKTDFNKRGDVTKIPKIYRISAGEKTVMTDEEMNQIREKILTEI